MHYAANNGHEGAMKLLKEWGGDPLAKTDVSNGVFIPTMSI